ncbi:MAG: hypothetical protein AAF702_17005 [Chloroflexota bacterium]
MSPKSTISTLIQIIVILTLAACGSSSNDKEAAVAVALPETAATQEYEEPPPIARSEDSLAVVSEESKAEESSEPNSTALTWQTYANPEGFIISYPPHWQQAITSEANAPMQQVTLSGPEGFVELSWGVGFGGACPEGVQPIQVAQGELNSCTSQYPDGRYAWNQVYASLPDPDVGFGARAETVGADPLDYETILQIFSTLTFVESN